MDKQYILQEIRRIAKANGGVPLGRAKFFLETGIKECDWQGKHWARWSEAVAEAGFSPNQMQTAYPDEVLLEKFASLIRELGRFPVVVEMRMKKRKDPSFPNEKAFERFGTKAEFAQRIRDYCKDREGWEDVVEVCSGILANVDSPTEEVAPGDKTFGFVYLMKSGRFYKVGRTNAAGRRERELAIQLPEKATIVHKIRTDDPVGIENYWHKRFESKRKNGEWFNLGIVELRAFKRRKFM